MKISGFRLAFEDLKRQLWEDKRLWSWLSLKTGLSYQGIADLASGKSDNPKLHTLEQLDLWLGFLETEEGHRVRERAAKAKRTDPVGQLEG